jgi:hypothetical protein
METNQPRGVQEQVSAVSNLLSGGSTDEPVRDEAAVEEVTEEPEQIASGESHEDDAVEDGIEAQAEEAEVGGEQGGEIRTLTEFAKAAGWTPEDIYGLSVRLDTGEEIPIGQMKDALQMASRERAEINAARENLTQEYQRLRQAEQQILTGQNQISQEERDAMGRIAAAQERYSAVDWEGLSQTDPGRAAFMQQQMAVEYAGAKDDLKRVQEQRAVMQQQVMQQLVAENNEKFLSAVPEWRNPAVAQKEAQELDGFLMEKVGFAPQELASIVDARARVVALMALRWYQHIASVQGAVQKVRKAPKPVVQPGNRKVAPVAVRKTENLVQRAKTTQKRGDQVAAIQALLNSR